MKEEMKQVVTKIKKVFESSFGQTPLRQRNEDILREAIELSRFTSIANLKEEHGDLLCSLLMSCAENGWDPKDLIEATLKKIQGRCAQYHAYGRKLNVAILGGAFDPIHRGHIAVAQFVLDFSTMFDQVWLMPCYKHLYGKKMTSWKHRLEMCRLAAQGDRRIVVSDYEIKHKLGGETYHLAKKLLSEDFAKGQYDFSFIIGMDNADTFDKWQNFEDLERMMRFVVVPRQGYPRVHRKSWYLSPPHMYVFPEGSEGHRGKVNLPKVSSTEVKRYLSGVHTGVAIWEREAFLTRNLNGDVREYIKKNGLYRE